ncbi:MAG TPA: helix-turn-helix domain-containing protein [Puia sp.]|jgi:AraC-like DNA-binding protein|nr:helix-turn-helix domain-containing protein [Puia sp.]
MKWQFEDKTNQGKFFISSGDPNLKGLGLLNGKREMINTIVFNPGPAQYVTIDKISYSLPNKAILPLVANQTFSFEVPENLIAWQFNREFYCIVDHDIEVGCVGFLFYGIQHPFFIQLSAEGGNVVSSIQALCVEDMLVEDRMQGEMLRTMLKRLIIYITRLAKQQTESYQKQSNDRMDMIRQFNLLLEIHFRSRHEVQFYAQTMNKSPKTLTNLFGLCNYPSPSELIRQRILLEAKRYLYFTDKSAKEVASDLGFTSVAHFSRFFKAGTGRNFSEYKELV